MPKHVALDTGILVALIDRDDDFHALAIRFLQSNSLPTFTTVPVLTEAMYLLSFSTVGQLNLLEWVHRGSTNVENLQNEDWQRIIVLTGKYADLPIEFADASIVATCERLETKLVATLDADFNVYRYKDRQAFQNIFPAPS
jgi:predicted nucleic acid-binding protein